MKENKAQANWCYSVTKYSKASNCKHRPVTFHGFQTNKSKAFKVTWDVCVLVCFSVNKHPEACIHIALTLAFYGFYDTRGSVEDNKGYTIALKSYILLTEMCVHQGYPMMNMYHMQ